MADRPIPVAIDADCRKVKTTFHLLYFAGATAHRTFALSIQGGTQSSNAAGTGAMTSDAYSCFQAADGVCKTDRNLIFQIGAAGWRAWRGPAREILTEYFGRWAVGRSRKVKPLEREAPCRRSVFPISNAFGVKTIFVIEMALVRMAENFIGLRNSLEPLFRTAITRIYIRVESPCEPSKRLLDVRIGRSSCDFKNEIKIVPAIHPNTA